MTRTSITLWTLTFGLVAVLPPADARITRIEITRTESPTFGGASFGSVGPYEKLTGRAYGEIDPADPLHRGIALIDKAPRNAAGRVEYSMDVVILKPVDLARGNRTLFYDVVNRGSFRAFSSFHVGGEHGNNPATENDAGDAFFMRRGYTLVMSGWQADTTPGGNRLIAQFPVAREADGKPVTQLVTAEYIPDRATPTLNLGHEGGRDHARPHAAVPERMAEARLMRRSGPLAPRELIPNSQWSFGACPDGKNPKPSNTDLCYPAGFSTDYIYELVYVAQDPLVMGLSFAATRDLVSFLRYERSTANPLVRGSAAGEPVRHAIGFGRSQSGRYIKDLVYQGFNIDESRRVVFDGILPLISGSRITLTNMAFATPGRIPSTLTQHYYSGDQFPFTYATLTDPVTGRTDGWLAACTRQKACPKVIHMDSGTEAWGARNSLVVTDAAGRQDLPVPDNVRLYYFASTQHGPTPKPAPGLCKNLGNPNPYRENLRALLAAMQAWVEAGTAPPPSRFPRVSDGTLAPPAEVVAAFPKIPGVVVFDKLGDHHVKDFSVQPPVKIPAQRYAVLVPKVDADGNDVGGIHSTDRQVPLGTYTGWNVRRAGSMENEFCDLQGSFIPFAKTAADRGNDPRPSLAERYGSHANYVARVEAAANRLVADRLLLQEDAVRLIAEAKRRDLGF